MKKNRQVISIIIIVALLMTFIFPILSIIRADAIDKVVSLGDDLTEEQQNELLDYMDVGREEVHLIKTTIQEEAEYLKDTPAIDHIGSNSISSAYVERLDEGDGIAVDTHNISWVTEEMYANALVTAGVKNANIIAAAPFSVSGTGALTGIMKAFEEITGQELDQESKKVATEEMVVTGELGEELEDQEGASELVRRVKEEIIEEGITNPEEIRRIIIEIQEELNINLSEEQIQKLTELMDRIKNIDINVEDLKEQVSSIGERARELVENSEEAQSLLQRIGDLLQGILDSILNIFR